MQKKVLITGANGFIGEFLVQFFLEQSYSVIGLTRKPHAVSHEHYVNVVVDYQNQEQLQTAMQGVDVVLHTAALVHQPKNHDPIAYERDNVDLTETIARMAGQARVQCFILMSSIKVFSDAQLLSSSIERPLRESLQPLSTEPYGLSKRKAEEMLSQIKGFQTQYVALRLPLVYGPHARGNVALMKRWIGLGIPNPLRRVCNERSVLSLDNLASACHFLMEHHFENAFEVFQVTDPAAYSTPQLFAFLAKALGKKVRWISVSPSLLRTCFKWIRKSGLSSRLLNNAVMSTQKLQQCGFVPTLSTEEGMRKYFG